VIPIIEATCGTKRRALLSAALGSGEKAKEDCHIGVTLLKLPKMPNSLKDVLGSERDRARSFGVLYLNGLRFLWAENVKIFRALQVEDVVLTQGDPSVNTVLDLVGIALERRHRLSSQLAFETF
jgi:hypothetical protein